MPNKSTKRDPHLGATRWCARLILTACASTLLFAGTARGQAGGLYLPENGGPLNGTAQAGSGALARDAETAWLNPAGMTRLGSPTVMLSLMPVYVNMEFNPAAETTAPGSNGGNQGGWIPAGALFAAIPISERVALGFSVTAPVGLEVDPTDDWVGQAWMTEAQLIALNFEPSVGVRLSSQWSLGAGFAITST